LDRGPGGAVALQRGQAFVWPRNNIIPQSISFCRSSGLITASQADTAGYRYVGWVNGAWAQFTDDLHNQKILRWGPDSLGLVQDDKNGLFLAEGRPSGIFLARNLWDKDAGNLNFPEFTAGGTGIIFLSGLNLINLSFDPATAGLEIKDTTWIRFSKKFTGIWPNPLYPNIWVIGMLTGGGERLYIFDKYDNSSREIKGKVKSKQFNDGNPQWSPDGLKFSFSRMYPNTATCDLLLYQWPKQELSDLLSSQAFSPAVAWYPDGRGLLCCSGSKILNPLTGADLGIDLAGRTGEAVYVLGTGERDFLRKSAPLPLNLWICSATEENYYLDQWTFIYTPAWNSEASPKNPNAAPIYNAGLVTPGEVEKVEFALKEVFKRSDSCALLYGPIKTQLNTELWAVLQDSVMKTKYGKIMDSVRLEFDRVFKTQDHLREELREKAIFFLDERTIDLARQWEEENAALLMKKVSLGPQLAPLAAYRGELDKYKTMQDNYQNLKQNRAAVINLYFSNYFEILDDRLQRQVQVNLRVPYLTMLGLLDTILKAKQDRSLDWAVRQVEKYRNLPQPELFDQLDKARESLEFAGDKLQEMELIRSFIRQMEKHSMIVRSRAHMAIAPSVP
jgi:hypothetical protein